MALTLTELLCLRISDGMGRERDFEELKRRGIDPKDWETIRFKIAKSFQHDHRIDLSDRIMEQIQGRTYSLREHLLPSSSPDMSSTIIEERLELENLPVFEGLKPEHTPELVSKVDQELDTATMSMSEALSAPSTPDLSQNIMSALGEDIMDISQALLASNTPDLSSSIFKELNIEVESFEAGKPNQITTETLETQESESDFDLGTALRSDKPVSLWDGIESQLVEQEKSSIESDAILQFPQNTLSDFEEDEDKHTIEISESEAPKNADVISFEINAVAQVTQDVIDFEEGPDYPIDIEEETSKKEGSGGFGGLFLGTLIAVAAGLSLMFFTDSIEVGIEDPIGVGEEVLTLAEVNDLEVESLEWGENVMVHVFQSEENAPTIIYIDDSLLLGEEE